MCAVTAKHYKRYYCFREMALHASVEEVTRVCLLNPDLFEAARMAHRKPLAQSLQIGNRNFWVK